MTGVGLNSFGGPVAQIGVMHRVAVEERRWVSEAQFVHLLNFANILPGPEALEIAIHLGYIRRGVWGGIAAGVLFIWPGFFTLTLLAWIYQSWGHLGPVAGFLDGIRPVAMALVAAAAVRISRKALQGGIAYLLMTASFLASFLFGVQFLIILVGCGLLGLGLGRYRRATTQPRAFGWMFLALVAGLLAWRMAGPVGAGFVPAAGETLPGSPSAAAESETRSDKTPGRLADIAWVNTKAALVTFGGAYTVLPYLREQVVHVHPWLTDRQVVDALALGETTPGPLICVGVFLSFLAGGLPGALVGCLFLFLPSFVLVLTLGRSIERVEKIPRSRDVLWGFSAGTLGLILALAAGLVPASLPGAAAWILAAAAFLAVHRWRVNPLLVVLAGGVIGTIGIRLA